MLKFSCEKTLLQQAVSTVSRAVAAKSSIPALEGVLLEGDTQLTLSGYNMQTGIRTAVAAEIHQEGRIVLNARLFGEMIRRLPDDIVVFSADEKYVVKLVWLIMALMVFCWMDTENSSSTAGSSG